MEFFKQLFTELNTTDSITVIAFLFGAWLIGIIFGRLSISGKLRRLKTAYQKKEADYKMLNSNYENLQNTFKQRDNDFVKAKQQFRQMKLRNQEVEKEMSAYKNQYAEMHGKFNKVQNENVDLKSQLETAATRISTYQEEGIVTRSESDTTDATRIRQFQVDGRQMIPGAYDADDRLAAIEDKLEQLEFENTNLRDELSRVKTPDRIVASDGSVRTATTTIRVGDRSTNARTALTAAIGTKIPKASADDRDDLKQINGIGPFIEEKLNKLGIYTYDQISQLDNELVNTVTDAIQFFPGRIDRDNWVEQAGELKG